MSAKREPTLQAAASVGVRPTQKGTAAGRPARPGVIIGRFQRTVVVTVHGELDGPTAAHLGLVLADLIDGQGNLSLAVDLHDVTVTDVDRLTVLAEAAERARRRGGAITLGEPPAVLHQTLKDRGLDHLVPSLKHRTEPEQGLPGIGRTGKTGRPCRLSYT